MKQNPLYTNIPGLAPLLADADHVDVKQIETPVTMREFIAGMISYYPAWIKNLYRIRWAFVRLLGMKQEGLPPTVQMAPADVPMTPGANASFFKVALAQEDMPF